MKTKSRILGISLVAMLLISMLVMAAPVSAGTLKYSTVTTPSGANNQILASDASFIKVASDGTLFAVDTAPGASDVVYKSTNGGVAWTASAAVGFNVVDMEVSPNYATDMRVFLLDGSTAGAVKVFMSTNGGATFNQLGGTITATAGDVGMDLAVAPNYTADSGEIMVAVSNTTGTTYGDVYAWGTNGVLNWVSMGLTTEDVSTVAFSPNYPIDATKLAIGSLAGTGTRLHSKVQAAAFDATITGYPVMIDAAIDDLGDAGTPIVSSDIAMASDWNGSIATLQRCFVATVSGSAILASPDNVYRITGTNAAVALNPEAGGDQEYTSIVYSGDYNTGNLIIGIDGNTVAGVASQVRRCADPTSTNPLWYGALKAPTGTTAAAGPNTYLALDPNFATNSRVYASTAGAESAVSVSNDGGINFNQSGLIHTTLAAISNIALANSTTFFMTTTDSAAGPESLWKTTDGGANWYRINAFICTTAPGVKLSPNYATDNTVYFFDIGGTTIRMSADGGGNFVGRIAPAAINDILVVDGYSIWLGATASMYSSTSGGWVWSTAKATGVTGIRSMAYDATTGHLFVGDTGALVRRSTDSGATWASVGGTGFAGGNVLVVPDVNYSDNNIIYAAGTTATAGIWRNTVATGSVWEQIDAGTVTMPAAKCVGLVMDADGTLYAADSTIAAAGVGGVMRSLDPRATIGAPVNATWEVSSTDDSLTVGDTLAGMALTSGSNVLILIENVGTDKLLNFTDTLTGAAPDLVTPNDTISSASGAISFDWLDVTGAKSYWAQVSVRDDFKDAPAAAPANLQFTAPVTNATGITADSGATAIREGATYYWRVRVQTPVIGPWSEARTIITQITTVSNAPAISSPSEGGTGPGGYNAPLKPLFQWAALKWATGYEFQLATDPTFAEGTVLVDKTGASALGTTTVFQPATALDYSSTYYWRVKGLGTSTTTDWSPVTGFSTMAEPVEAAPPVVIEQAQAPIINIPASEPATVEFQIPDELLNPQAQAAPAYIWAVIIIGAVLVIAVGILIVKTRRVV